MTVGQKASASLLIAVLLFAAFAVAAFWDSSTCSSRVSEILPSSGKSKRPWQRWPTPRPLSTPQTLPASERSSSKTRSEGASSPTSALRTPSIGPIFWQAPRGDSRPLGCPPDRRQRQASAFQHHPRRHPLQSEPETVFPETTFGGAGDPPYESISAPEGSKGLVRSIRTREVSSIPCLSRTVTASTGAARYSKSPSRRLPLCSRATASFRSARTRCPPTLAGSCFACPRSTAPPCPRGPPGSGPRASATSR